MSPAIGRSGRTVRPGFRFDLSDERLARAAWSRLAEPGDARAAALIGKVGPSEALRVLVERDVDWMARYRPRASEVDPEQDLGTLAALGGRLVQPGDPEWPVGLDDLDVPPVCLWVRGPARLHRVGRRSVAVVGARAATDYGEYVASDLAFGLVERGFTVVSGLAYGIDAAAHRGALATVGAVHGAEPPQEPFATGAGAPGDEASGDGAAGDGAPGGGALGHGASGDSEHTDSGSPDSVPGHESSATAVSVGVVAGGIDRAYPRGNDQVMAGLARVGAVVSEVPPGSHPSRARFLQRNRLIAALTRGTVVVEAAVRSGSLNTARTAAALGRPVGVVPGPVTSAASAGCHALARSGAAALVTSAAEVADLVGRIGEDLHEPDRAPDGPLDGLDRTTARVYDALPVRSGRPVDRLARTAGLDEATVRSAVGRLSLLGLATRDGAGWRVVRPPR